MSVPSHITCPDVLRLLAQMVPCVDSHRSFAIEEGRLTIDVRRTFRSARLFHVEGVLVVVEVRAAFTGLDFAHIGLDADGHVLLGEYAHPAGMLWSVPEYDFTASQAEALGSAVAEACEILKANAVVIAATPRVPASSLPIF